MGSFDAFLGVARAGAHQTARKANIVEETDSMRCANYYTNSPPPGFPSHRETVLISAVWLELSGPFPRKTMFFPFTKSNFLLNLEKIICLDGAHKE